MTSSPTETQNREKVPRLTEQQEALVYRKMQLKDAGLPENTAWNIAYGLHAREVGHASISTEKRLQDAIDSLTEQQRTQFGITMGT